MLKSSKSLVQVKLFSPGVILAVRRNSLIMRFLIFFFVILTYSEVSAVALKMSNDSEVTIRIRGSDRGHWRGWKTFNPGDWGNFATKVARTKHRIQIDAWVDNSWQRIYEGTHGSRVFTRVFQLYQARDGNVSLRTFDEPPGCRSRPPHPNTIGSSCLRPSGNIVRNLFELAWDNRRKALFFIKNR